MRKDRNFKLSVIFDAVFCPQSVLGRVFWISECFQGRSVLEIYFYKQNDKMPKKSLFFSYRDNKVECMASSAGIVLIFNTELPKILWFHFLSNVKFCWKDTRKSSFAFPAGYYYLQYWSIGVDDTFVWPTCWRKFVLVPGRNSLAYCCIGSEKKKSAEVSFCL